MPEDQNQQQEQQAAIATAVRGLLAGVRAEAPRQSGALTLIPLMPTSERVTRQTGYLPLEEALRQQVIAITEQAQASVPELRATSTAPSPVVLLGGEQVVGGLQNRVLNTTILVAAQAKQEIPVTCVEAGRWHSHGSRARHAATPFEPAPAAEEMPAEAEFFSRETAYASLRKLHATKVSQSLKAGGGYRSDQHAVWNEVSTRMRASGVASPSAEMHALYSAPERASRLEEMLAALEWPEGAVGFVAVLGKEVLGAELFSDAALAQAYWGKLARSYALEALDSSDATPATTADDGTARLLADALAAEISIHPSPGLGTDARLAGQRVSGAGLVHDGAVVHLSLFPEEEAAAPTP